MNSPARPFDSELRSHLDRTIGWLRRAQDAAECGGVSAGYTVARGWQPAYPETTGYLIPTMRNYAGLAPATDCLTRWTVWVNGFSGYRIRRDGSQVEW